MWIHVGLSIYIYDYKPAAEWGKGVGITSTDAVTRGGDALSAPAAPPAARTSWSGGRTISNFIAA